MVDSEPSFPFAYPILGIDGEMVGSMSATFKLSSYQAIFDSLELPSDAILGLVDRNGTRLFFYPPKATNPVGGTIKASVWNGINAGGDSGLFIDSGSDGIDRFYAFKKLRLEATAEPYMYVVYAFPTAAYSELSRSILRRNIMLIVLVAVFAVISSGLISRRLFGARLARIIAVTSLLREGELGARAGLGDDRSDLGQIATALDLMAGTIEKRNAETAENARKIEASLAEKEILLREVHHRVKNNLQLIMSLFSLQENESASPADFKEAMENRIKSLSTVHEMLYESDDLGSIELGAYARRLVELVSCSAPDAVRVSVDADEAPCSLDTAVPFGLLLNELVTNAFKHAFRDRADGTLRVTLRMESGRATLEVEDDGPGLPAGFAVSESSSLGLRLAGVLAEQLGGSLAWGSGSGAHFTVRFRIDAFRNP
jgi:two-component sensor histidine kinase